MDKKTMDKLASTIKRATDDQLHVALGVLLGMQAITPVTATGRGA